MISKRRKSKATVSADFIDVHACALVKSSAGKDQIQVFYARHIKGEAEEGDIYKPRQKCWHVSTHPTESAEALKTNAMKWTRHGDATEEQRRGTGDR